MSIEYQDLMDLMEKICKIAPMGHHYEIRKNIVYIGDSPGLFYEDFPDLDIKSVILSLNEVVHKIGYEELKWILEEILLLEL
jgi:hypothetical protein